jgi:hypothetical protein
MAAAPEPAVAVCLRTFDELPELCPNAIFKRSDRE